MNLKRVFSEVQSRFLVMVCCAAMLFWLSGCGALKTLADASSSCESQPLVDGAANVSLFLKAKQKETGTNLRIQINSIEILVDDLWVPMPHDAAEINSINAVSVQRFLGRQWIKGQYCRGVRLTIGAARLIRSSEEKVLQIVNPETVLMLQRPVELEPGSRKVLSLEWNPEKSVSTAGFEGMSLYEFARESGAIAANLAYIACPEIDTIYVVGIDKYQIVDAIAVRGNPTYLALNRANNKIYVLVSSLNKIVPIDLSTHLPGTEIHIPMANELIFMTVNNLGKTAYVLDSQGVLSSIDLVSGNMLQRGLIGSRPNYLYYISQVEKLVVSSTVDQTVYFVNPNSLAVEDSLSFGSPPSGLLSWENYLYVAEKSTNSVSVYDLSARKMLKSIQVGSEPSRLVANDNSVYVANYLDGTIAVIPSGQLIVSKEVSIGKSVGEMCAANKQRLLFVSEEDCEGSLAVVDTTGNTVIARVELGAKPKGIAVLE